MEERRADHRYELALQVKVRPESDLDELELIRGETHDISTGGFYFNLAHRLGLGTRFKFSIPLPPEVTEGTQAFISGQARVVRVDEKSENGNCRVGVGALIERYRIMSAESAA
jgi:c-di-GMP-binding flagellar brake protein YcgR